MTNKKNSGIYSVQIFEYKNNIPFINASSLPIKTEKPVLKKCLPLKKSSQKKCFKTTINNHILNNISSQTISKQDLRGQINFQVAFSIDNFGKISNINSIAPNEIIKVELDRIIASFNEEIIPAKHNRIPIEYQYIQKSNFFIDGYQNNLKAKQTK